jgi:hypothetical protein
MSKLRLVPSGGCVASRRSTPVRADEVTVNEPDATTARRAQRSASSDGRSKYNNIPQSTQSVRRVGNWAKAVGVRCVNTKRIER